MKIIKDQERQRNVKRERKIEEEKIDKETETWRERNMKTEKYREVKRNI